MHAIETVVAGEIYASQAITGLAMHKFAGGCELPPGLHVLSDREMAVFALIAAGHGTSQIAKELGISHKTVETPDNGPPTEIFRFTQDFENFSPQIPGEHQ